MESMLLTFHKQVALQQVAEHIQHVLYTIYSPPSNNEELNIKVCILQNLSARVLK